MTQLPNQHRCHVGPPLPYSYFGNALVWLGATIVARDIASEPLVSIAKSISGAISRMDDELVRSMIDYLELAEVDSR
jgi:shikimate O-hydroxycinnamoyltransferase